MKQAEYFKMFEFENFYWWYKGLNDLVFKTLEQKLKPNSLILDAGCGTGKLASMLRKKFLVECFDFSELAISLTKKRNLLCYKQDLNHWQPPENKYNAIISLDVLCEKGIENDIKIIQKFHQALKPKGLLILNLPAFKILKRHHDKMVYIKKRYSRSEIKKILEDNGFKIVFLSYRLPFLFFVILTKKLLQKIFKTKETSDLQPIPQWLNSVLYFYHKTENLFLLKNINLPFGSSVFAVAEKI